MEKMQIGGPMIVVSLINGMVGGVILVLPLLALESGSISSGLIISFLGIISYYSCMLCVKHLGSYSDLDQSIFNHFGNKACVRIFYELVVFFNLFFLLILYFDLIVSQWEQMTDSSVINPTLNFFALVFLTLAMKYFEFGVSLLAYGIISCLGYCVFLIWMLASSPSGD